MASLPGAGAAGDGTSASGGLAPPSTSPSLAGFMMQPGPQALSVPPAPQVQLQLPFNIALPAGQVPLLPLGGGGRMASGGGLQHHQGTYFALPFAAAGAPQAMPLHHFSLPVATGPSHLGGLSLGWPALAGDSGSGGGAPSAAAAAQLPPTSSGVVTVPASLLQGHQQPQQQMQLLHALDLQQAALSAPQIMSNTDHGGSTEGTQAWGGGGGAAAAHASAAAADSARGAALPAEDSAAAESRLKAAPAGRRGGGSMPRKSRFRGVQWDRNGSKWRARIHTDKTRHIGYFEVEEDAGKAWDLAALKHFGETPDILSKLNFRDHSVAAYRQQQAAAAGQADPAGGGGGGAAAAAPAAASLQAQQAQQAAAAQQAGGGASPGPPLLSGSASGSRELPSVQPLAPQQQQQAQWHVQVSVPPAGLPSATAGTSALLHTPAVLPLPSPKRRKLAEDSTLGAPAPSALLPIPLHGQAAGGGGGAAACAAAASIGGVFHSPPEAVGSRHDESAGFSGVLRTSSGGREEWQAYLTLDLGRFGSAEEAARAHDRAALLAAGLLGPTNFPLPDAFAAAAAATVAGRGARGAGGEPLRGVALRPQGWLALLDIAGSPYELGPYPSELAAAQAHDRYSILLHGVRAQTNFPPCHYIVDPGECQALLGAVIQVQQAARASAATPQGAKMPTPPSAEREGSAPPQAPPHQAPQAGAPPQQAQQAQQAADPRSLQQQMGLPPGMGDPYAPAAMAQQAQQAQQQQQALQLSADELARSAGLPDLPPAADLGTQLARLESIRALSSGLSADAAAAAVSQWQAAGGQPGMAPQR